MTPLQAAVRQGLGDLATRRIALVGGLAVSARAEPRFTRDVDLAVAVANDGEAERLIGELLGKGYRVAAQVDQEATGRLATVRTVPSGTSILCDLLFASSGIEPELVAHATSLTLFDGCSAPVASVGHLIAVKLLARSPRRLQDDLDLDALAKVARPADLLEAETSLQLVTSQGFARDKNLDASSRPGEPEADSDSRLNQPRKQALPAVQAPPS
ncbi:MAG: nucleotidyl transferase AbiEii/AbiGii toxin family protein [Myxococcaceae bacterium]|nr:nucleotidyl transferase AbiEii/AbiGii toxin family protein [Myxococcaceae bacterium]